MALAEWLIPRLSLSAEAQLQSHLNVIRTEGPENVDQLVRIACSLAQQNAIQAAIIRQAIGHVGALEMNVELGRKSPHPIQRLAKLLRLG